MGNFPGAFSFSFSFSPLFLCSFVKNLFLLCFDQLDFLLLLFLCMSSSTGQPLSFPLPPLKMNGELSFLLRNWSVRIFLILISSLIIGCSSSIKIDQAFLLSYLTFPPPPPPPITTNLCRKIINTSHLGKNPNMLALNLRRICLIKNWTKGTYTTRKCLRIRSVSTQIIKTQTEESVEFLLQSRLKAFDRTADRQRGNGDQVFADSVGHIARRAVSTMVYEVLLVAFIFLGINTGSVSNPEYLYIVSVV